MCVTVRILLALGAGGEALLGVTGLASLHHLVDHHELQVLDLLTLLGLVALGELLKDFEFLQFLSALLVDNNLRVLFNNLDLVSDLNLQVIGLNSLLLALNDSVNAVLDSSYKPRGKCRAYLLFLLLLKLYIEDVAGVISGLFHLLLHEALVPDLLVKGLHGNFLGLLELILHGADGLRLPLLPESVSLIIHDPLLELVLLDA